MSGLIEFQKEMLKTLIELHEEAIVEASEEGKDPSCYIKIVEEGKRILAIEDPEEFFRANNALADIIELE